LEKILSLADETAPHFFYTRGFILHEENNVPDLIARAFGHHNASRYLLAKGATEYLADSQGILATVAEPGIETLEPIGGTGDTLTGIAAALLAAGLDLKAAAVLAARANRLAGLRVGPLPPRRLRKLLPKSPRPWRFCDSDKSAG
jgi:NAD(P)H-hydrate repair Nnr-like enzyme with NAD(P)H-hydrate dehydratase domain